MIRSRSAAEHLEDRRRFAAGSGVRIRALLLPACSARTTPDSLQL